MKTIETKIAKNDARLYYVDSKRVSRQIALEVAAQNRVGNPFVVEYDTEQTHFFVNAPSQKFVYTARKTFDTLNLRIDSYKGFTVYCGTSQIRWFVSNVRAKNFAAQIEDAFINGEHGIKIALDGTISVLPAEIEQAADTVADAEIEDYYAVSEDAFDAAVEGEIENAANVEVNEKFTTVKAENAANAVAILGELNFRNVNFVYHGENYSNDYKIAYRHFDGINADGNGTCFALIEIVINGKLDTVRFINTYRETAVDIKIGDANCNVGDKGEIELIDEPATVEAEADTVANTVAEPDTKDYFELADELDEIGNDICDTKDILAQKIAGGAPQTEIKSLEGYIDEREDEYRTLHKRIYDVNPQSDITVDTEQAADTVAVEHEQADEPSTDDDELNTLVKDATIAIAVNYLQYKRNDFVKKLGNLNANKTCFTQAEIDAKAAELKGEIGYLDLYIAALNAGDTFDYAAAKTHIADVYEDVRNCVEFWSHEHGLTKEQSEMIYVAAHCDRNFDAELDRDKINGMIGHFKQAEPEIKPAPDAEPELDEDEIAEKFYRETESTFREMKSAVAPARKFLREHIFDIYHFDYALRILNQRGELKACPNKFHLVDTRFDVEVDRCELDYVIYFGYTELARYRTVEGVNRAVDQFAIAIANRRFEFTFPTVDELTAPANEKARLC